MGKTRPKDIGTRQETAIKDALNDFAGYKVCERVILHGNKDHGDLRIEVHDLVLTGESKHCKRYPSVGMIESFKVQTVKENDNAGQDGGLLFVNLPGRSIQRMEVWMRCETYIKLLGIACDAVNATVLAHALLDGAHIDASHDWLRLTLLDFMYLCWGSPAWGRGE